MKASDNFRRPQRFLLPLSGFTAFTIILLAASAAQAVPVEFTASLNGPSESPPNASLGTGFATVDFDLAANTMRVRVDFTGLTTGTTASHIHCCTTLPFTGTAIVATTLPTFPNFPLGVTSGTYDQTFDMTLASSYNPAFITAEGGTVALAEAALFDNLFTGKEYLNIHTTEFPSGEIRGFLTSVPEPGSLGLMATALFMFGVFARRNKRRH